MCITTVQKYDCGCRTTLYHICIGHIDHTHKQIDTEPCPKSKNVSFTVPARCPTRCKKRRDVYYDFEHVGETVVQRQRRINREWDQERHRREEKRRQKDEEAKANAEKLAKDSAEYESGGGRGGGKRIKHEPDEDTMDDAMASEEVEARVKIKKKDVEVAVD